MIAPARPRLRARAAAPSRRRRARGLPGAHHRRRRVGPVRRPSTSQRPASPSRSSRRHDDGRRHVVAQPLPGRRRRHAEPPVLASPSRPTTGRSTSPLRDELHDYLERVADRLRRAPAHPLRHRGLSAHATTRTPRAGTSTCATADGDRRDAARRRPDQRRRASSTRLMFPDIPGLDTFAGPTCHTARWPEDVDLDRQAGRHHRQRGQRHADSCRRRSRTPSPRSRSSSARRSGRRRSSSSASRARRRCASCSARCRCTGRGTGCGWAGPSTTGSTRRCRRTRTGSTRSAR